MKNTIALFLLLFTAQTLIAQNVRFSNGAFDNGLMYPIGDYAGEVDAKKAFNANILEIVSEYKDQDYCISQYGFVQHNKFIQLNFYFNCIDMDESKTESYLFNLSNGEICLPSEMISEDKKSFQTFLEKKISSHYTQNGKDAPTDEFLNELSFDTLNVNLLEKGLEISLDTHEDWPETSLLIAWSEISPYLKHLQSR